MSNLPKTYVPNFHNLEDVNKLKYNNFGTTDMKISEISLGTGGFSDLYGNYTLEDCKNTVLEALKLGINYIDTAPWYGQGSSEEILGKCLKNIPRESYYLATKVGRYEKDPKLMFDFSAEKTKLSLQKSLEKLGVDYVDVIQVHDIEFAPSLDVIINETLPTLEEAVKNGKARYIGITGYPVSVLQECISRSKTKIDTILSYSRLTLLDDTLNDHLEYFRSKNLGVVNAAVLAMGLLTNGGPQIWHPAQKETKDICLEARDYCKLKNVELAKLATHFAYKQNKVDTTLIGMNNVKLLRENVAVLLDGLNANETETLRHIQNKIFSKLQRKHWEGVEIENYKKSIA